MSDVLDTLALSSEWDLYVDGSGNIATASAGTALAQDAASACKTFSGEVYYDTTQGIPFFAQILGKYPALSYVRSQFVAACLTVPGAVSATVYFTAFSGRALSGQIQVTDSAGTTTAIGF